MNNSPNYKDGDEGFLGRLYPQKARIIHCDDECVYFLHIAEPYNSDEYNIMSFVELEQFNFTEETMKKFPNDENALFSYCGHEDMNDWWVPTHP